MSLLRVFLILILSIITVCCINQKQFIEYAERQYTKASKSIDTGYEYPEVGVPTSQKWNTSVSLTHPFWPAFYPGVLWLLYNMTNSSEWQTLAIEATDGLYADQNRTDSHDIGFDMICSYGHGYQFTRNANYPKILINAANHLAMRYNYKVGCTRSWNSNMNIGEFTVISDNMMNLELFFEAWKHSGNNTFYDMAVSHANRTIKEFLRADYSNFHVVAFNDTDGSVVRKYTVQGYADWSCWARSQAWLVSGLTTTYRYTKMKHILEAAEGVSNYFITHSPNDGVPYWDFDVRPNSTHPYVPRDTSAASIAASGLIELYSFTKNQTYLNHAVKVMNSLFSDDYRANGKPQYNIPALIVNGTQDSKPNRSDIALIFGDYYYMKAVYEYFVQFAYAL